jgi:hypothetical protein
LFFEFSFCHFHRLVDPCDCKSEDGKEATGQQLFAISRSQVVPSFEWFTIAWQGKLLPPLVFTSAEY